jgi:hypothetical protein
MNIDVSPPIYIGLGQMGMVNYAIGYVQSIRSIGFVVQPVLRKRRSL